MIVGDCIPQLVPAVIAEEIGATSARAVNLVTDRPVRGIRRGPPPHQGGGPRTVRLLCPADNQLSRFTRLHVRRAAGGEREPS
jgi:hypothetical protein